MMNLRRIAQNFCLLLQLGEGDLVGVVNGVALTRNQNRCQIFHPLRYSCRMNRSASGQFTALRFFQSHSRRRDERYATFPRSTASVSGPEYSNPQVVGVPLLHASIHSR